MRLKFEIKGTSCDGKVMFGEIGTDLEAGVGCNWLRFSYF